MLGSYAYVSSISPSWMPCASSSTWTASARATGSASDCRTAASWRPSSGRWPLRWRPTSMWASCGALSDQFPFTVQVPSAFIDTSGDRGRGLGSHRSRHARQGQRTGDPVGGRGRGAHDLPRGRRSPPWPGRQRTPDEVKATLQAQGTEPLYRGGTMAVQMNHRDRILAAIRHQPH